MLSHNTRMNYTVVTKATEDGVSAWVPGLPGCWSEGATEEEALANVQEAIADYLAVAADLSQREDGAKSHTVRVNVA
jgi:predicted RNase H-like HicB family nuclease